MPRQATITISGTSSTSVSGITVNSLQIMAGTATASTSSTTLATNIAAQINSCTQLQTSPCQVVGYSASASGSVVTITAPGAISYTPAVTKSGSMTFTVGAFTVGAVPGDNLRTTIAPSVTSYPYPGSSAKAATRTDCLGSTCSYAEEMTNYANWWTYYKARMQAMKTAASNAFSAIDNATDIANNVSRFRLGYMSINNNTNSDFLNLGEFSNTQKYNWYTKLISANPANSTPLRATLSEAGRYYAGKLGSTYNGVAVTDPLQYSCQQNYAILSTDGFWNESSGYKKMDGSTDVGNQDAALARPYYDGGSAQIQTRTSTLQSQSITPQWLISTSQLQSQSVTPQWQKSTSDLQVQTSQLQSQTSQLQAQTSQLQSQTTQLQKQTSQLQSQTTQLQKQTSQLQSQTSQLQAQTSQLQSQTSQLQRQISQLQSQTSQLQKSTGQLQSRTSSNSGSNWTTWADAGTCAWKTTGNNRTQCQYVWGGWTGASSCAISFGTGTSGTWTGNGTDCQTVVTAAWAGAATCTTNATPTSSGNTTQCQTIVTSAYGNTPSCTATTTPDSSGNTTQCQTIVTSAYANAASCTATTTPNGSGQTTQCQTIVSVPYANVASCTASTTPNGSGKTTQCQTVVTAAFANAATCTATTTPNGSGQTTQCQTVVSSAWAGASTCAATTTPNGSGQTTQCQSLITSAFANAATCAATTTPTNSGNTTQCQTIISAPFAGASTCTATTTPNGSGQTTQCQTLITSAFANSATCTASTTPNSSGITTQCQTIVTSAYANAPTCTASTTPNGSGQTTQCKTVVTSAYAPASSCTATTTPNGSGQTTQCQTQTSGYAPASSCTTTTTPDGSGNTTQCQYTAWSTPTTTGSCTALAQSTTSPYTVATATQCTPTTPVLGGWTNADTCTTSSTTNCRYTSWTTATTTSSCAAAAQSPSSPYTVGLATQCTTTTPALGTWTPATSCTVSGTSNCQYTAWTGWSNASACTAVAQSTSPNYTVGTARDCQTTTSGGTSNTLADVAAYYYNTDLRSPVAADGTGTCTGPIIAPNTTANDLCANNVPDNGRDVANTQHMTTFTLGLGSQGQMIYAPNDGKDYWNDTSGDFYDVKAGTTANASAGICSWQSSGACNWPTPASNSNANIDDLWHAAINGHGTYFSAKDPKALSDGLTSTLATIANTPRPGTAAAAASSNPNVSSGDNFIFSSSYKSVEWYGELTRQQIGTTGTLTAQNWSAMRLIDCATTPWTANTSYIVGAGYRQGTTCYTVTASYTSGASFDSSSTGLDLSNTAVVHVDETAAPANQVPAVALTARTIYTKGATGLIAFTWSAMSATQQAYFTAPAISYTSATSGLSQFCTSGGNCLSAAAQSNNTVASGGAAGEALVNFLRGDRSQEGNYFRTRIHVLGDIVDSEARYVKAPLFNYTDANYSAYKSLRSSRSGVVYAGANDGMLHAFDATSGQELWAYIPSMVLPNLYKLADKNYATQHQFTVDETPEVGEICPNAPSGSCAASEWKTILVGGLNRGGKGYYALDVTDPTVPPKLLWEFTDTNLGYSFGNPRISKLKNGTWVVLLTSGYNNADGLGRLYVLNANTGALIRSISTGVGSTGSPSGLAHLSAHVVLPDTDNTTVAAYAGDTLGNLWRFDVNGDIGAAGYDAQLLVSFKDAGGNAQPITSKPTVTSINGKPVIYVGTGRYLGTTDVTDTSSQSFYAVLDKSDANTFGNPRTATNGVYDFVQQTLTNTTCPSGTPTTVCTPGQAVRTSTSNAVDWSTKNGWYIDFLTAGERSISDSTLGLGSLLFTTIRPQGSTVSACGDTGVDTSASFLYVLNYLTGSAVIGSNTVAGLSLGSGLVTRPVLIELPDGSVRAIIRTSKASGTGTDMGGTIVLTPTVNQSSTGNLRRVSWRELTTR